MFSWHLSEGGYSTEASLFSWFLGLIYFEEFKVHVRTLKHILGSDE